jgi:hypothetical protein
VKLRNTLWGETSFLHYVWAQYRLAGFTMPTRVQTHPGRTVLFWYNGTVQLVCWCLPALIDVLLADSPHYLLCTCVQKLIWIKWRIPVCWSSTWCEDASLYKSLFYTSQRTDWVLYEDRPVNAMQGNNRCLLWYKWKTQIDCVVKFRVPQCSSTWYI